MTPEQQETPSAEEKMKQLLGILNDARFSDEFAGNTIRAWGKPFIEQMYTDCCLMREALEKMNEWFEALQKEQWGKTSKGLADAAANWQTEWEADKSFDMTKVQEALSQTSTYLKPLNP